MVGRHYWGTGVWRFFRCKIVDIRFPMVVYEKLLAPDIAGTANFSVDDLLDVSPDTARGLLQLLEFDGNVEEVAGIAFYFPEIAMNYEGRS